jgi:hypothetical protein
VESYGGFDLHFLYVQEWWALFHVFLATWISFFETALFSSLPISSLGQGFFGSLSF